MTTPKLHKGAFRGTDGNGNDHYGPDYYIAVEVEAYIKSVKRKQLHIDLVQLEIDKIRKLLKEAHGALLLCKHPDTDLMLAIKLQMETATPEAPVPSSRIFG
jgi:hypothetical protein